MKGHSKPSAVDKMNQGLQLIAEGWQMKVGELNHTLEEERAAFSKALAKSKQENTLLRERIQQLEQQLERPPQEQLVNHLTIFEPRKQLVASSSPRARLSIGGGGKHQSAVVVDVDALNSQDEGAEDELIDHSGVDGGADGVLFERQPFVDIAAPPDLRRNKTNNSNKKKKKKKHSKRKQDASPVAVEPDDEYSDVCISPARHAGPQFAAVSVVRGKRARAAMPAHQCQACEGFAGAMALELGVSRHSMVQKCSRHRAEHQAPNTPPGYWSVGFGSQ